MPLQKREVLQRHPDITIFTRGCGKEDFEIRNSHGGSARVGKYVMKRDGLSYEQLLPSCSHSFETFTCCLC